MNFQIPTTTAAAPFNFGQTTTTAAGAAAKQQTFGSLGSGDAGAGNKPIAFTAPTMTTAANIPAASTPPTGLTFGATAATPVFGTGAPTQATNLQFGAPATTQPTGLNFGAPATTQPTGLNFGAPATAQPTGLNFGVPQTTQPSGLNFGSPATTQTTGLNFGSPATTQPTGLNFGAPATTQPTGLNFGSPANTQPAGLTAASTASTVFSSSSAPTTAATTVQNNFSFGTSAANPVTTTATTALSTMLSLPKSNAPISTTVTPSNTASFGAPTGFANLSTATKTTDSSQVSTANQISYHQLEEHINKWTLELEEQEKIFTDQATQINAWDKVLIGNNKKIVELNEAVQKVKADQQTLEQELEFISTQHKELEDSLLPLHNEFINIPPTDMERSMTYMLVENLDTQLKQMSEDLKEIIDNLNEANKGQDNTDPIIQIGKILNAHMSSLQWIETSSTNICNKLEDLSTIQENFKRESERSFRSAYYN